MIFFNISPAGLIEKWLIIKGNYDSNTSVITTYILYGNRAFGSLVFKSYVVQSGQINSNHSSFNKECSHFLINKLQTKINSLNKWLLKFISQIFIRILKGLGFMSINFSYTLCGLYFCRFTFGISWVSSMRDKSKTT